jgi:transcriptional regulator of aromatic amino acid metabolism
MLRKIIGDALKKIDQKESNKIEITNCFSTTTNLIKHFKPDIAIVDHELAREEDIDDEKSGYDVAALLLGRFHKLQVLVNTGNAAENENGTYVFQRYLELKDKYPDRISFQEKGGRIDASAAGEIEFGLIGPISKAIRTHLKISDQATKELVRLIPSRSKVMREFLTKLGERIRVKGGMVVLQGKAQSGKTYIAEQIQEVREKLGWAPTSSTFTKVNIGAEESADENLFLSELFGHKKGSFSGAIGDKVGIVQKAMHGTILLDEIAEASKTRQTLLLDLLRDGKYKRVGGNRLDQTHAFLVLATYKNIHEENRKRYGSK